MTKTYRFFKILAIAIGIFTTGCSQVTTPLDPIATGEWLIEGSDAYGAVPSPFKLYVKFDRYDYGGQVEYGGKTDEKSTMKNLTCFFKKTEVESTWSLTCSASVYSIYSQGQFSNNAFTGTYTVVGASGSQPQPISMRRE